MDNKNLLKLADGLFTSKIRFGLQLLAKVRINDIDAINQDIENIQKVQNKLLRLLTNKIIARHGKYMSRKGPVVVKGC